MRGPNTDSGVPPQAAPTLAKLICMEEGAPHVISRLCRGLGAQGTTEEGQ